MTWPWRPVSPTSSPPPGVRREKGSERLLGEIVRPDAPALRRLIAAGEEAKKKNLKIAAGFMCRHSVNRQEMIKRIRDGEMASSSSAGHTASIRPVG